jgi:AraC-like DNA-binding protein
MALECGVEPHVRGLLKSDVLPGETILRWFEPHESLAPFVQRFWSAHWNVPAGERRVQPILPYPCANLIVAGGEVTITGVLTRATEQRLEGAGHAYGAKLSPGALRAFRVARPSALRDQTVAAETLMQGRPTDRPANDVEACIQAIESHLLCQNPKHDPISLRADAIVRAAENDREIVTVSQLADSFSLSVRSIQDICNRAIGVSPKWLIRCFRLQDALQALETGLNVNLAALAQDLGYFDQAHFTRDFKQITGATPGRY